MKGKGDGKKNRKSAEKREGIVRERTIGDREGFERVQKGREIHGEGGKKAGDRRLSRKGERIWGGGGS